MLVPLAKPDPADADGQPDSRTTEQRQGDAIADTSSYGPRTDSRI
jgi:hypothetical protein